MQLVLCVCVSLERLEGVLEACEWQRIGVGAVPIVLRNVCAESVEIKLLRTRGY